MSLIYCGQFDEIENSPVDNSHVTKIEDYFNKKSTQVALEHLKSQIIKEIKHEFAYTNNKNLNNTSNLHSFLKEGYDLIKELDPTFRHLKAKFTFSENKKRCA